MLNGIKVLNEYFICKEFPMWCLFLTMIIIIIGAIISVIGIDKDSKIISILGLIFFLCFVIPLNFGFYIGKQPSDIKEYKVTISDNVSMVEFNEKYDVIKVEGKIYTIREKE